MIKTLAQFVLHLFLWMSNQMIDHKTYLDNKQGLKIWQVITIQKKKTPSPFN
jgi:hypothetical protein